MMRRGILWTLMATVGLSALALWFDQTPRSIVAAADRFDLQRSSAAAMPRAAAAQPAEGLLPTGIEPIRVEAALRNAFLPVTADAPSVASPPPAVAAAPFATPIAPPLSWRYLGFMVTPSNQRLVMLVRGDTTVTVQPGTPLDDGYVVQAVDADAVRIVYQQLGTVVNIPIPFAASPAR